MLRLLLAKEAAVRGSIYTKVYAPRLTCAGSGVRTSALINCGCLTIRSAISFKLKIFCI